MGLLRNEAIRCYGIDHTDCIESVPSQPTVPTILVSWLAVFRPCFTTPVWDDILVLVVVVVLAPGSVLSLECLLSADASLRRARRATSLDTTGHGGAGRYQGARQCQPGVALSYEHAGKIEAQLKAEVAELLAKAEAADQADVPDGMSVPEELARREARLAKLAEARAKIETVPRNALSASRPNIRQSSPSGRQRPHHRQEARRQGAAAANGRSVADGSDQPDGPRVAHHAGGGWRV